MTLLQTDNDRWTAQNADGVALAGGLPTPNRRMTLVAFVAFFDIRVETLPQVR